MLNLIKTETAPLACELIENLESILDSNMSLTRTLFGNERLLSWLLENEDTGFQVEIVFDPENVYISRQGRHITLEHDEYELAQIIEESFDDGFSRVWLHVNFNRIGA